MVTREGARRGMIKAKGDYYGSLVVEETLMEKDGYLPRYRGVNGKGVTIVVIADGSGEGEILAVRDCEVLWLK